MRSRRLLLAAVLSAASCAGPPATTPSLPVASSVPVAVAAPDASAPVHIEPPDAVGATCPPGMYAYRIGAINADRGCVVPEGRIAGCSWTPKLPPMLAVTGCVADREHHLIYLRGSMGGPTYGSTITGEHCTYDEQNIVERMGGRLLNCGQVPEDAGMPEGHLARGKRNCDAVRKAALSSPKSPAGLEHCFDSDAGSAPITTPACMKAGVWLLRRRVMLGRPTIEDVRRLAMLCMHERDEECWRCAGYLAETMQDGGT